MRTPSSYSVPLFAFSSLVLCAACGDSGTPGTGGGGTGGANTGGDGTGGSAACAQASDCAATEYCAFADGQCGAGAAGHCAARPAACSDGLMTCFCDGTVSDLGCPGISGADVDFTGAACTAPTGSLKCAQYQCSGGTTDYCRTTPDDTGGPPSASCEVAPTGCDPAACACLTAETTACGGTCTDSAEGPTILCPGG